MSHAQNRDRRLLIPAPVSSPAPEPTPPAPPATVALGRSIARHRESQRIIDEAAAERLRQLGELQWRD